MSPRAGLNETIIIAAAEGIADKNGYEAVTLASVADALNIRPPSLYNHIEGLGELKKRLAINGLESLFQEMSEASEHLKEYEAILAASKAYLLFALYHPGLYESILKAPNPNDPEVLAAAEKVLTLVVQLMSGFHLKGDNVFHSVRGLRSILHGFASLEQGKGFNMELDLSISLEFAVSSYLYGLKAKMEEGERS
ncbi:TetR-like C-terminal domain-containing protein [Metabacillus sp. RGM 3146]|uniref:TetR-like C-terminal domain-containing protein n=1 Tax=Metabacillus sp. RGM 3146 TaxID=3401092 RepID=UPI003B9B4EB7